MSQRRTIAREEREGSLKERITGRNMADAVIYGPVKAERERPASANRYFAILR